MAFNYQKEIFINPNDFNIDENQYFFQFNNQSSIDDKIQYQQQTPLYQTQFNQILTTEHIANYQSQPTIQSKKTQTRPHTNRCSTIVQANEQSSKSIKSVDNSYKVEIQFPNNQLQIMKYLLTSQSPYAFTKTINQTNQNKPIKVHLKKNFYQKNKTQKLIKLMVIGNNQNNNSINQRQFFSNTNKQNIKSQYFSETISTKHIEETHKTHNIKGVLLAKNIKSLKNKTKSVPTLNLFHQKATNLQNGSKTKSKKGIRLFSNEKTKQLQQLSQGYKFKIKGEQKERTRTKMSPEHKKSRKLINLTMQKTQRYMSKNMNSVKQKTQICLSSRFSKKNINPLNFFNQRRINI